MFNTEITKNGTSAKVELIGDLNATASDAFVAEVSKILESDTDSLVPDMSRLEFLSSSGLRKLLTIKKMVAAKSGSMSVENISADIMQILKLTGFDSLLGIA